jgi:putative aldouronate transport system permease protein
VSVTSREEAITPLGAPTTARRRAAEPPLSRRIWQNRGVYVFIIPGFLYFVVFRYVPMLGNIIAFQDYSPFLGFTGSPFVGLQNFGRLFTDSDFAIALRNTLQIAVLQLVFFFPAPLGLALLLNSIASDPIKRFIQSVVYLPHFMSWVILVALWLQIFGGAGFVNQYLRGQGLQPINVMANPSFFQPLMVLQLIWKETGWGTIIFLAALTTIEPSLYEAAAVDGANGWRRLWHITLPGIRGVIILLLIIRLSAILNTGFEQFFLQRGAVGARVAEVLDTFTYFRGIEGGDWGFSTAVGLVKGVVGMVLVIAANKFAKRFGEEGVY